MAKRLIALFLAILMTASVLVISVSADSEGENAAPDAEAPVAEQLLVAENPAAEQPLVAENPAKPFFPDVAVGTWFYNDVMALYEAGVIDGFTDGTFRPAKKVTTGQALKMIILAAGYEEPERVASHWARGYMNFALENGFFDRGEIRDLDVTINRELVGKIAANALGITAEEETLHFSDTDSKYVQALYEVGIIDGYTDGTYRPRNLLSRAELSAIVNRIYTYQNKKLHPVEITSDVKLRTTEKGVDMIKALEGFVEKPYFDYQQYSIGYGSRCDRNDYPDGITREEADALLRENLKTFEDALDAFLTKSRVTLSDTQYDALISFTYNVGTSWLSGSRLKDLIASGRYTDNEFASAMGIWCHVGSSAQIHTTLINRRIREIQLFLYGDYRGTNSPAFHYVIYSTEKGSREVDIALYRSGTCCDPLFGASSPEYTFLGWYTGRKGTGTEVTASTVVSSNMTIYAYWLEPEEPDPIEDPEEQPEEGQEQEQEQGQGQEAEEGSSEGYCPV